ncbi:MAG: pantetheine-phosphate adenylyltransferase [Candidatus Latescibacteria bacterium 4484_7]|nr:MAG: pantetheine-phosphate adenylyltransferase [Candidatus Latescibacteria bacterium 4484_7]RKZ07728.1 MAG: pantetheine-phosphate adenylyltransferase [bacterium]
MRGKVALYPGTFDPITNGHIDLVERASKLFDRVIVAVAAGVHKAPFLTLDQRYELVKESLEELDTVDVVKFDGLLVDVFKEQKVDVVIRGLRAVSDFEYELMIALMNRKLNPDFETVFLMPSEQFIYLHSSLVKEIYRLGGEISCLVPECVVRRLKEWDIK